MKQFLVGISVLSVLVMSSCSKSDSNSTPVAKTKKIQVAFGPVGNYTLFSFKDTGVVANTDSNTTKWDFGLRFTTFIVNSHAGGPGNAGAILQPGVYSSITEAPTTNYAYDTATNQRAIKDGSWYDYNPTTHAFTPKAGQVFFFRTADNKYVKMELISVDYGPLVGPVPSYLEYNFRYTYQPNGSNKF